MSALRLHCTRAQIVLIGASLVALASAAVAGTTATTYQLKAQIVGSSAWEIKNLARPHSLKLHRTPLLQLFTPWTNFCLEKEA